MPQTTADAASRTTPRKSPQPPRAKRLPSGGTLDQRARLAAGLVLFTFVLTHFLNHAVGNISLAAMQTGQDLRYEIWSSLPGQVVLYGAFTVHIGLALWKLARRRTWRMPAWEAAQLLLGLAIPYLLIAHVIGTRGAMNSFHTFVDYRHQLSVLWPDIAWTQSILLLIVWTHGCMGLHFWLRLKRWYPAVRPWLAALAIVVPTLALTGWINAARLVAATVGAKVNFAPGQPEQLATWTEMARWAVLAILIAVLLVQAGRWVIDITRPRVTLLYRNGRTVQSRPGPTLLEISRAHGIPHTSVCGGRARCSTCRTLILAGGQSLPPPGIAERAALDKAGAGRDVRLACQIRPVRDLEVQPLLAARRGKDPLPTHDDRFRWGVEQQVAVMFIDLRGFTSVAEHKLPFDTVFILNRYLDGATGVIRAAGGSIDKVMGDGIMALFGVEAGGAEGARQALHAIVELAIELEHINDDLAAQLEAPLRLGIGVHTGPAILGRIGLHGHAGPQANITALGDTVNVASRLEGATKELSAFAVVSQDTVEAAGLGHLTAAPGVGAHAFAVRGRAEPLAVLSVPDAGIIAHAFDTIEPIGEHIHGPDAPGETAPGSPRGAPPEREA